MCLRHKVVAAGLVEHPGAQVLLIHVMAKQPQVAVDVMGGVVEALSVRAHKDVVETV
jgi:hypothetical protein